MISALNIGLNALLIELFIAITLHLFAQKIDKAWLKFDSKKYNSEVEESKFQRKSGHEQEAWNEYFYEVEKYLEKLEEQEVK